MNETLREGGRKEGLICKRYRYIELIIHQIQVLSILFSYKIYETIICVIGKQIFGTTFTVFTSFRQEPFWISTTQNVPSRKSSNTFTVLAFERFILSHVILLTGIFWRTEGKWTNFCTTNIFTSKYFLLRMRKTSAYLAKCKFSQLLFQYFLCPFPPSLFVLSLSLSPFFEHRNYCFVIIESRYKPEIWLKLCSK